MRSVPLTALLAAMLLAPFAGAQHCGAPRSEPELAQGTPSGSVVYLDVEPCAPGDCIASVWIYEESNGLAGLQRDDFRHSDVCGDEIGDTLVALAFAADPRA